MLIFESVPVDVMVSINLSAFGSRCLIYSCLLYRHPTSAHFLEWVNLPGGVISNDRSLGGCFSHTSSTSSRGNSRSGLLCGGEWLNASAFPATNLLVKFTINEWVYHVVYHR